MAEGWRASVEHRECTSRDGTRIHYEVMGEGARPILMANGLGGRLHAWEPLIDALHQDYRLITWDYRGLFESETPKLPRHLAVAHHVEDALAVLDAEGVSQSMLCGWSMGVQVGLELAATYGDRVSGLVLLNGTYGHTLTTGFQPLFSVPYLPKRLHAVIEWVRKRPEMTDRLAMLGRLGEPATLAVFSVTTGRRVLSLRSNLRQYMDDVLGESFENYLRLFQELDAHSVYHLLPEIDAPTLVISGALDPLTPARQSREIARRMPHAELIALKRAGHFAMLERPEVVIPAIERFLVRRARWTDPQ